MFEIVSSVATGELATALLVLLLMLRLRSNITMMIGSVLLISIAIGFLYTSINLEAVLLRGPPSQEVLITQPSIEIQRLKISFWNAIVSMIVGGVGINIFSSSIVNYITKKAIHL
jgi:hypothetical protein